MNFKSFDQLNQFVDSFTVKLDNSSAYSLDRIKKVLNGLDNPQEKFKTVHIAGTSGKTSTAYYIANMLNRAGLKVGLSVSPHITEVNERVQIGLIPLPEKEFCLEFSEFIKILNTLSIKLTYFELFVTFVYWYFAKARVDHAVIEVGLGGTLDATNVIRRPDKICVITDIGLDHTDILGNELSEIAAQKAGIIQQNNEVFTITQSSNILDVIKARIKIKKARLHIASDDSTEASKKLNSFQHRNWSLAKIVCKYIFELEAKNRLSEQQWKQTALINIPGRLEVIKYQGKTLVLDGAHNGQKMKALVSSYQDKFSGKSTAVLLAITDNKSVHLDDISTQLNYIADHTIITSFDVSQDSPKKSIDLKTIEKYFTDSEIESDPDKALKALLERKEDILLVTGSLYLISIVKKLLAS